MIRRRLYIGRWRCDFYFFIDDYDREEVVSALLDIGAPKSKVRRAERLMDSRELNSGFTYSDAGMHRIITIIGPTSDGEQFINTFVHELRHAVNDIAEAIGYRLDSEVPSYMAGDAAMALADVVCSLGCRHCRE